MKNNQEKQTAEIIENYPENLPEQLRQLHDRFIAAKVLILKGHPHADRVGMVNRMEFVGTLRKWGFVVRFNNDKHDEAFVFEGKHIQVIEKPKKPEKTEKPKSRKFEIYGRTRIIRDVRFDEPDNFEAFYQNYFIHVWIDDDGDCAATCHHPNGGFIVDGGWSDYTIEAGIKECLENIFYSGKT